MNRPTAQEAMNMLSKIDLPPPVFVPPQIGMFFYFIFFLFLLLVPFFLFIQCLFLFFDSLS